MYFKTNKGEHFSWDIVGIGGDYNGAYPFPHGLENVSKYPNLFAKLIERLEATKEINNSPKYTEDKIKDSFSKNIVAFVFDHYVTFVFMLL